MKLTTIPLTLSDLAVGLQETVLVIRHGREDETSGVHGEIRRSLYRKANAQLSSRELDFSVKIRKGSYLFDIHLQRFYHHAGSIGRICYIQGKQDDVFKRRMVKAIDFQLLQLAFWAASIHFETPPIGCFATYAHLSENPNSENPIENMVRLPVEVLPSDQIDRMVNIRLEEIIQTLDTPDSSLPECSPTDRFAVKQDSYCKCRSSCRARNVCQQYADIRASASSDYQAAKVFLSSLP